MISDAQGSSVVSESDMLKFSGMFQKELQKYLKGKGVAADSPLASSHFVDFAGTTAITFSNITFHDTHWLIDSGASRHISGSLHLFTNLRQAHANSTISLPDGTIKYVSHLVDIVLSSKLILKDVLYVPSLNYNFLSVARLAAADKLQFQFDSSQCLLQDPQTKTVVAKGVKGQWINIYTSWIAVVLNLLVYSLIVILS